MHLAWSTPDSTQAGELGSAGHAALGPTPAWPQVPHSTPAPHSHEGAPGWRVGPSSIFPGVPSRLSPHKNSHLPALFITHPSPAPPLTPEKMRALRQEGSCVYSGYLHLTTEDTQDPGSGPRGRHPCKQRPQLRALREPPAQAALPHPPGPPCSAARQDRGQAGDARPARPETPLPQPRCVWRQPSRAQPGCRAWGGAEAGEEPAWRAAGPGWWELRHRQPRPSVRSPGAPPLCWPGCSNRPACAAPRSGSRGDPPTCGGWGTSRLLTTPPGPSFTTGWACTVLG